MNNIMVLITGATGQLGSSVIDNLLETLGAENIIALARDKKKAEKWVEKGIAVRIGDYQDKSSLVNAFQGVVKLLLITSNGYNALQDHRNVIKAALEAKVKHIFYTSGARNSAVAESKLGPLWDSYVTTENDIKDSGIVYTMLKCGLYAETIPFFLGNQALQSGIYFPAADARASFAKRSDMGEAIAKILVGSGHENKSYLLTGGKTFSFREIAGILSELTGKIIPYVSPDQTEYKEQLKVLGVPESDIEVISLLADILRNNEYEISDSTLAEFLGRDPISVREYLKEVYLNQLA